MTRRNKQPIKAALFAALLCLSAAAQPQTITGKVVAIADGDTLTVLDASNRQHKIRLDGIDAPESSQDWGSRAKQSLSDLVFGKTVTVISSKKDRYGRTLGKVMLDKRDINLEQIGVLLAVRHEVASITVKSVEYRISPAVPPAVSYWHVLDW
jgi:endonuclease YncB( thermonuclease family)